MSKNYAFKTGSDLPPIPENRVFDGYKFSQLYPHTEIFAGEEGLTFRKCNIRNCDLPADAVIEDCYGVNLHMSRCSHVHPNWTGMGLPECEADCSHVVDTDVITIDGVVVDTVYHYADRRVE